MTTTTPEKIAWEKFDFPYLAWTWAHTEALRKRFIAGVNSINPEAPDHFETLSALAAIDDDIAQAERSLSRALDRLAAFSRSQNFGTTPPQEF